MDKFHVLLIKAPSILGIWHHSSFVINLVQLCYLFYSGSPFPFKHQVVAYRLSQRNPRTTLFQITRRFKISMDIISTSSSLVFHETHVLLIWKHIPNLSCYARRNRHAVSFSQMTILEVREDAIKLSPHCVIRDNGTIVVHHHLLFTLHFTTVEGP